MNSKNNQKGFGYKITTFSTFIDVIQNEAESNFYEIAIETQTVLTFNGQELLVDIPLKDRYISIEHCFSYNGFISISVYDGIGEDLPLWFGIYLRDGSDSPYTSSERLDYKQTLFLRSVGDMIVRMTISSQDESKSIFLDKIITQVTDISISEKVTSQVGKYT